MSAVVFERELKASVQPTEARKRQSYHTRNTFPDMLCEVRVDSRDTQREKESGRVTHFCSRRSLAGATEHSPSCLLPRQHSTTALPINQTWSRPGETLHWILRSIQRVFWVTCEKQLRITMSQRQIIQGETHHLFLVHKRKNRLTIKLSFCFVLCSFRAVSEIKDAVCTNCCWSGIPTTKHRNPSKCW